MTSRAAIFCTPLRMPTVLDVGGVPSLRGLGASSPEIRRVRAPGPHSDRSQAFFRFPVASSSPHSSSSPWSFDAVIFDLDGVITETASVHARAWKQMFDEYLAARAGLRGEPFREFVHAHDYLSYVDGKPRYQGVEAFLASRGIRLPFGSPADPAGAETICGLGNRKNELFNRSVETAGIKVYASSLALIHALHAAGRKAGLATSSRNSALVLKKTQTAALFATIVDGLVSEQLGLQGKPQPDIFLTAAVNLGVTPLRAVVVEDAVSGVSAGAAGGFGLVIGVAREDNAAELREAGAGVVVADLAEISVEEINRLVRRKETAA